MRALVKGFRIVQIAAVVSVVSVGTSFAATIGTAVTGYGSSTAVLQAATIDTAPDRATLAAYAGATNSDVIGYYIPLSGQGSCTYGVSCGTSSDTGSGGSTMAMWIKYSSVSGGASRLKLYFEDLDLIGANDPTGFFEDIRIFNTSDVELAFIELISDARVSGTASTQQTISLSLGNLTAGTDYWTKLLFSASYTRNARNTPEFLVAEISAVPIPAAGLMLLSSLAGLGFASRRRRRV